MPRRTDYFGVKMMRYVVAWLLGVPISILLLLYVFTHLL